jgi:membrane protein
MPETNGTEPREASIGELVHDITQLVSTIIRGEIALAKLEITDAIGRSGAALALFLVAAFLAMAGIVFVLIAAMLLLTPLVGSGLAALIVTVALFVAAAITANAAKKKLAPELPRSAAPASQAPSLPAAQNLTTGDAP